VRTKRNKIYSGANVENASYGLTVCAERCAVWAAVAAGETKDYDAIAIVIDDEKLPTPCGACRQVIAEFAPDLRVVLATTGGLRNTTTLTALLPEPFLPGNLA
jgi:cytidine deaminase